jgi:hypothetical protein
VFRIYDSRCVFFFTRVYLWIWFMIMFHHFPQDSPYIGGYRNPHLSDLHLGNPEKISKPQSSAGFGFWSPRPAPARPGRPGISCTEVQGWGGQVGNSQVTMGFNTQMDWLGFIGVPWISLISWIPQNWCHWHLKFESEPLNTHGPKAGRLL